MTLITVDDRLKISALKADGAAAASGNVKVGDIFVAVNGVCVTSEAHAKELITGPFGTSLQAELYRRGQSITVTLWRGRAGKAKGELAEKSEVSTSCFSPRSSSVAITPLHSSRPVGNFIDNTPISPLQVKNEFDTVNNDNSTPVTFRTPAEDRTPSGALFAQQGDFDLEPFVLHDLPIQLPASLRTLTRFAFEALVLSEWDGAGPDPPAQYRSLDAISCIGEDAVAQSRGCVFVVTIFDDHSAAIIPHRSLLNFDSGSVSVQCDVKCDRSSVSVQCDRSSQISNCEASQPRVLFWMVSSVASDTHHVIFDAVPPLSVMLFPGTGLFHTEAAIIDMCLPDIPRNVHGYSLAFSRHFQNLKQLHLFGDKKAAKALRLHLTEARLSKATSLEKGAPFLDCMADFEIFVFGKVDLGCFGAAGISDHHLEFRTIAPSIFDIEVLVLKTRYLQKLVSLLLYDCQIGPDGAAVVAKMLSSDFHCLNYLSLSQNPLHDEGCSSICDSLIGNTSLTKLSLGHVNATSITADHVFNLLSSNSVLKNLSLYENPIEEAGFLKIFDALHTNSSLTILSFQDCSEFNAFCAIELKSLLQSNVSLTKVGLSGNKIGRELDQDIMNMYGSNQPTLKQNLFAILFLLLSSTHNSLIRLLANEKFAEKSNWYPTKNQLKFMFVGSVAKTKFGLDLYSNLALHVTFLVLNNNLYDHESIGDICAMLIGLSNLQKLHLDDNAIGSKGLLHLSCFITANSNLKELSLRTCSIEFLPKSFVTALVNLDTCFLGDNPDIPWPSAEVCQRRGNAFDIHRLFSEPIQEVSKDSWISIQDYLTKRCSEECLGMILNLIQFEQNGNQFCTSDCAKLWIIIVGVSFEAQSLYSVIENFIDRNVPAWPLLASCSDEYDRKAITVAVGATKQFLSSRCFFMGLYDIRDDLKYEYKSATCTVYLVDRVETNKRTRVALKFMKNEIEFEREISSRNILSMTLAGQRQASQDYIIEAIDSYHCSDERLCSAVHRRSWLVDYATPCLLVMPAADRNLRIVMDNERITKSEVVKGMFRQILMCVQFMHKHGYTHGDLKPRNIMRVHHDLKLIDLDASAEIGKQSSWCKHSSAYMPPEAINVSVSLSCSSLHVAPTSTPQQCDISFVVSVPHYIPIGCVLTIMITPVQIFEVQDLTLGEVDLNCCASVQNYAINAALNAALDPGEYSMKFNATFHGNLPSADTSSATVQHMIKMLHPMACTINVTHAKCIATIKNSGKLATVPCECRSDSFLPSSMRSVGSPVSAECVGLCGLSHVGHDMWALGVILYRFSARQSLWYEDDEDNINDSGQLFELARWTNEFKRQRLQNINDTATRLLVSKLLEKEPWKRPMCIDDVLAMPFNEIDVIKLKLQQTVSHDDSTSSNLVGSVNDLTTGQFSHAAYGLRHFLNVAKDWDEEAACTLQGMRDEVELLKDCPDCARLQASVLQDLKRDEAGSTLKLAAALLELKEQRQRKHGTPCAADGIVNDLRSEISLAGGWHYGLPVPSSISWPAEFVKVGFRTFMQPMCQACRDYCLDYSSIVADLHYIVDEETVEKEFWNGVRDLGRKGWKLADFMKQKEAQDTALLPEELIAMRFYTSHSFNSINIAMRDQRRHERAAPHNSHPLPGIVTNIQRGLKKLRRLGSADASSKETVILWRGMSGLKLSDEFSKVGGAELAVMSTTTEVSVAISYAVQKDTRSALLFRFVTRNNLERGAEVKWLSMFPNESETLFPPLTFLQRTRTEPQEVVHCGVKVTVVEMSTTLA